MIVQMHKNLSIFAWFSYLSFQVFVVDLCFVFNLGRNKVFKESDCYVERYKILFR